MKKNKFIYLSLSIFLFLSFAFTSLAYSEIIDNTTIPENIVNAADNPRSLLKNSIEDNAPDHSFRVIMKNLFTNQKGLLFANIFFLILLSTILLYFYFRKPKKADQDKVYKREVDKAPISPITHISFFQGLFDKYLTKLYNTMDKDRERLNIISKHLIALNDKISLYQNTLNINPTPNKFISSKDDNSNNPYKLFLSSVGLISSDPKSHYDNYINSFSSGIEMEFFDDIPLDFFASHVAQYQDIVVVGTYSYLLTKLLNKGLPIRHGIGTSIQNNVDGGLYVPPALLPNAIKKTDAMVITNSSLSLLILNDHNILRNMSSNISETIVLPVLLTIPDIVIDMLGFSDIEYSGDKIFRWAIGFKKESKLIIHNFTNQAIDLKIKFNSMAINKYGDLHIRVSNSIYNYTLSGEFSTVEFSHIFQCGETEIILNFAGENELLKSDTRELKFSLSDMQITVDNLRDLPASDIYGTNISSSPIIIDAEIRKTLHDFGFTNIIAELISNNGQYRQNISERTTYLTHIINAIKTSATREIPICYIASKNNNRNE